MNATIHLLNFVLFFGIFNLSMQAFYAGRKSTMRPNCPYELFSYQPFWDVEIKHTALIGPSAHPTAMLQLASSDTGLWNTVPGLGNMTLIFVLDEHCPQVLCSGLHLCRRTDKTPSILGRDGKYHTLTLRLVPGYFSHLFHQNTSLFNGQDIPLDDVLPGTYLAEQVVEAGTFEKQHSVIFRFLCQLERDMAGPKDEIAKATYGLIYTRRGNISVSELSRELCYSPRYLQAVMRERIGVAPKEQCKNIRMQNALHLLSGNTGASVEQIAHDLGYYDAAHFVHSYTAFMGESPTDFRRGQTCFRRF
jgi:hypothetical protein mintA_02974